MACLYILIQTFFEFPYNVIMDIEFYRLQKVIYSKENNYPKFWNCGEAKWYISVPICFGIKYLKKKDMVEILGHKIIFYWLGKKTLI